MSQKIPVNKFEWTQETSLFNEDFIMNYNEKLVKDISRKKENLKSRKVCY